MTGGELWGDDRTGQGLVAAVDRTDLKKVWDIRQLMIGQYGPNPCIVDSRNQYLKACSPGTNLAAAQHRAWILSLLAEEGKLLPPEMPEDIKDVVFNVAAKFPMKRMDPGVVYEGLPFDSQGFVQEIEN